MSAYENFRRSVEYAQQQGFTEIKRSVGASRHLLNEIDNKLAQMEKLKELVKGIPLQEGDVVQEIGEPLERGDVLEVLKTEEETVYRVMNRHRKKVIVYSRDDLELVERPQQ